MVDTRLGLVPLIETVQRELRDYQRKHQNDPSALKLDKVEIEVGIDASVDESGMPSVSIVQPDEPTASGSTQRIRLKFDASEVGATKSTEVNAAVGLDSVSVGGPMYLDLDEILPGGHVFELPDDQQESLHKVWIIGGPSGSTEVDLSDMDELSKSLKEHIGLEGQ